MNKRLVIFDMDGTLTDSSLLIANAVNYVRGRLGLRRMEPRHIAEKINDPRLNAAEYFYEAERFEPRHEAWFAEYYTAHHEEELTLYPGIVELLARLRSRGYLMAVATNAYRRSTLETLTHLQIIDFFDTVVCYDDVSRGKPDPEMLQKVMKRLGCRPAESVFVGDGERDRMAAEAAGVMFVPVAWGFTRHDDALASPEGLWSVIRSDCGHRG